MSSEDLFNEVKAFSPMFLRKILCLVADTTSVNTGCKTGAFKRIKDYLLTNYGIEVHALECLMHVVELLFRYFFLLIEGPAKSPDKLQKDAVYNLISKINASVDDMKKLDSFQVLQCSPNAKAQIQEYF